MLLQDSLICLLLLYVAALVLAIDWSVCFDKEDRNAGHEALFKHNVCDREGNSRRPLPPLRGRTLLTFGNLEASWFAEHAARFAQAIRRIRISCLSAALH